MTVFDRSLDVFNEISEITETRQVDRKTIESRYQWWFVDETVRENVKKSFKYQYTSWDCDKKTADFHPSASNCNDLEGPIR